MKQIRFRTFETNSSSTHSVSIKLNKPKQVINNIPRNSHEIFKICEYFVSNGDEIESIEHILMSEVVKSAFILKTIVRHIDILYDKCDNTEDVFNELYSSKCGGILIDINDPICFKKSVSKDLIYTKWLKDVIYEETCTNVEFELGHDNNSYINKYFPYTLIPINDGSEEDELFNSLSSSLVDEDECRFKSLCREIIFNKDIIIVDKDTAYSSNYNIRYL